MAAVVVAVEALQRLEDAEAGTGFNNIGGGASGAAEAPFAYQGSNLYNRKVTSATGAGFYYDQVGDGGSAIDMSGTTDNTWMCKVMVSDYGGLDATDGLLVRIGSGTGDYYAFVLAGTDSSPAFAQEYRPVGGLLVVPVNPNENATYNDTGKDAGTPSLTAVRYFGTVAAFTSSSAKNENVGCDAIDLIDDGGGLKLTRGDGGDADGTWQSFPDTDEGTVTNRYGLARNADGGGILAYGRWTVGESGTAHGFTDNTSVITWLDHMAAAGFNEAYVDLGNASSNTTDGALHISAGTTTDIDSRADYTVVGTASDGSFTHQLRNFRNVTYTSSCTLTGAEVECADLTQGSADIEGNSKIVTTAATTVATCDDPTFGTTTGLNNMEFEQGGAGHAIELTATGTVDMENIKFTGYGGTPGSNLVASSGANDAAVFNDSGGAVTINVNSGGDTPSVRNGAGATTTVNSSVPVTVTVLDSAQNPIEGAAVYIEVTGAVEVLNAETNASGVATSSYSGSTPISITDGWVRSGSSSTPYQDFTLGGSITTSGYTQTAILNED